MCSGLDAGLSCLYVRGMHPLPSVVSVLGGALVASLLTVPAVAAPAPGSASAAVSSAPASTVGSAEVRLGPQEVTVDFVMALAAGSASFAPAGVSGEYRLTVRDAAPRVRVTELTTEKESASLPLAAFMAYWTGYGDVTGQFTKNPPRAVVQGTDADGDLVEVVVRLRDASRTGGTVKFDAEVITNLKGLRKLEAKVDEVDQTDVGEHASVSDPERLIDVEVFVDMPPKITQPQVETARSAARRADAAPTPRILTCNGVRSSRLTTCWNNITGALVRRWPGGEGATFMYCEPRCEWVNLWYSGGPTNGWVYEDVGVVDWGDSYWSPGPFYAYDWKRIGLWTAHPAEFVFAVNRTWYGVDKHAITWYATTNCTWFVARWRPGGSCW